MSGALATDAVDWPEGSAVEELTPLPEHDVNVSTADASKADVRRTQVGRCGLSQSSQLPATT